MNKLRMAFVGLVVLMMTATLGGNISANDQPSWMDDPTRETKGEINFRLTPTRIKNGELLIKIRADTHSGDLENLNLKDGVTLIMESEEYKPVNKLEMDGHHDKGVLRFDMAKLPEKFQITIHKVRSDGDITLNWE